MVYVADGLTHGADFAAFGQALADAGQVTELCCASPAAACAAAAEERGGSADRAGCPGAAAGADQAFVLAQSGDGRTLARARH